MRSFNKQIKKTNWFPDLHLVESTVIQIVLVVSQKMWGLSLFKLKSNKYTQTIRKKSICRES